MSAVVVVLIVLAVVFLGLGLLIEAAKWALIIAAVVVIAAFVVGFIGRGRTRV